MHQKRPGIRRARAFPWHQQTGWRQSKQGSPQMHADGPESGMSVHGKDRTAPQEGLRRSGGPSPICVHRRISACICVKPCLLRRPPHSAARIAGRCTQARTPCTMRIRGDITELSGDAQDRPNRDCGRRPVVHDYAARDSARRGWRACARHDDGGRVRAAFDAPIARRTLKERRPALADRPAPQRVADKTQCTRTRPHSRGGFCRRSCPPADNSPCTRRPAPPHPAPEGGLAARCARRAGRTMRPTRWPHDAPDPPAAPPTALPSRRGGKDPMHQDASSQSSRVSPMAGWRQTTPHAPEDVHPPHPAPEGRLAARCARRAGRTMRPTRWPHDAPDALAARCARPTGRASDRPAPRRVADKTPCTRNRRHSPAGFRRWLVGGGQHPMHLKTPPPVANRRPQHATGQSGATTKPHAPEQPRRDRAARTPCTRTVRRNAP